MKGTITRCIALVALVLVCSSAWAAYDFYPFPYVNKAVGYQYELLQMYQGWHDGDLVWFIGTDINDMKLAFDAAQAHTVYFEGSTYAPRLSNAVGDVATVYINLSFQQGPLFTDVPGGLTYSGLWQVTFVRFHEDVTPHAFTNTDPYDPVTNPGGLPSVADADFEATTMQGNTVIVKFPIVAVGQLDGPWYPATPGKYRIAQAKVDFNYTSTKQIWLPFWFVYCQDPVTKRVDLRRVIVPDVWDPPTVPLGEELWRKLGANIAPGLAVIGDAAKQQFYFMNGPKPFTQFPVIEACPSDEFIPWRNTNQEYSPVMDYVTLDRLIPQSSVISSRRTLEILLGNGRLVVDTDDQVINAPVIPDLRQVGF